MYIPVINNTEIRNSIIIKAFFLVKIGNTKIGKTRYQYVFISLKILDANSFISSLYADGSYKNVKYGLCKSKLHLAVSR